MRIPDSISASFPERALAATQTPPGAVLGEGWLTDSFQVGACKPSVTQLLCSEKCVFSKPHCYNGMPATPPPNSPVKALPPTDGVRRWAAARTHRVSAGRHGQVTARPGATPGTENVLYVPQERAWHRVGWEGGPRDPSRGLCDPVDHHWALVGVSWGCYKRPQAGRLQVMGLYPLPILDARSPKPVTLG